MTQVSSRVADERGESVGTSVGVMVRGESKCTDNTSLLFCTTGVLLQRLRADGALKNITHVVVDEVHDRATVGRLPRACRSHRRFDQKLDQRQ